MIKQIFTWWNSRTLGTSLYTIFFGQLMGNDESGNKYYQNKKGKRWVIYKNVVESSKIPPEWYLWIHFLKRGVPAHDIKKFFMAKKIRGKFDRNKASSPT